MKKFRIMLVDDHPLFRAGLENVINEVENLQVVEQATTTAQGFDKFQQVQPDLIISDLSFSASSGLALIKQIREIPSKCPILILSMHEESFWAEQVLQHGANGYIQKNADAEEIIEAILKTVGGEIYLSNSMQQKLLRQLSGQATDSTPLQTLSRREMEIYQYLAQGFSSEDIAENLFISIKTVQSHQANIKRKLKQSSIKDLRKLAQSSPKSRKSLTID
ncbi:MAG: response regulator transcription factor [Myxococcota bacterium]|nr:response regulator transcription factor [Myxococcota bacterium]